MRFSASVGPNAARNRGIAEASGTWISFCDDDDLWAPDKLHRQLAALRDGPSEWAYTGSVYMNDALKVRGGSPPLPPDRLPPALRRYNALPAAASNVIVRAAEVRHLGGFDEGLPHLADWDLWLRLVERGPAVCVPAPLVAYRLHAENFSFNTHGMPAELARLERRNGIAADRVRFHRHLAHLNLRAGRRLEASREFARAARHAVDGYPRADLAQDGRMVMTHVTDMARSKFGLGPRRSLGPSGRQQHDPNTAWKEAAQAWLDDFR